MKGWKVIDYEYVYADCFYRTVVTDGKSKRVLYFYYKPSKGEIIKRHD